MACFHACEIVPCTNEVFRSPIINCRLSLSRTLNFNAGKGTSGEPDLIDVNNDRNPVISNVIHDLSLCPPSIGSCILGSKLSELHSVLCNGRCSIFPLFNDI